MTEKSKAHATSIWLNESERSMLEAAAKSHDMKIGAYIKSQAVRRPIVHIKKDPALVAAVNRIGNNINQIARVVNQQNRAFAAPSIIAELMGIERDLAGLLE